MVSVWKRDCTVTQCCDDVRLLAQECYMIHVWDTTEPQTPLNQSNFAYMNDSESYVWEHVCHCVCGPGTIHMWNTTEPVIFCIYGWVTVMSERRRVCVRLHALMSCACWDRVTVTEPYSRVPGHINHRNDPASVFLSTHWWSQHPACQRCLFLVVSCFYKPLRNCHPSHRVSQAKVHCKKPAKKISILRFYVAFLKRFYVFFRDFMLIFYIDFQVMVFEEIWCWRSF